MRWLANRGLTGGCGLGFLAIDYELEPTYLCCLNRHRQTKNPKPASSPSSSDDSVNNVLFLQLD